MKFAREPGSRGGRGRECFVRQDVDGPRDVSASSTDGEKEGKGDGRSAPQPDPRSVEITIRWDQDAIEDTTPTDDWPPLY